MASGASRRRLLRGGVALAAGATAIGVIGCSAGKQRTGTGRQVSGATGTPSIASERAAATTAQPGTFKSGGVVRGVTAYPGTFDPWITVVTPPPTGYISAGFHYSRLLRFNAGPEPAVTQSREPVPDLVDGYEVGSDGLTYTMRLRRDVRFHPPLSRPLTSADVLASWRYLSTAPKSGVKALLAPIVDSVRAPDPATVVFTLKQPSASFLNKLANPSQTGFWVLPEEGVAGSIDLSQRAIGTGPWIIDGRTPTAWTWHKNPDYFIKNVPYADGAHLDIIADTPTQETQFVAGKLDILDQAPFADIPVIQKAAPGARGHDYVPLGLSFLGFSPVQDTANPFHDMRMRQAASAAIDRQRLIDTLYGGRAVWQNIVPTGLGKWSLDPRSAEQGSSAKWFQQDLKATRQLIGAAGHADTEFKLLYPFNAFGDVYNATAEAVGRMLTDAGFTIAITPVDFLSVYINNGQGAFWKAPPNTITFNLQGPFTDPDDYLTGMLTRDGARNTDLLDDPDLAALAHKQAIELDERRRLQLVYDVQRAHADKMYYPPIIYGTLHVFTQPWVQNYFVMDSLAFGTEQYAYLALNSR